MDYRKSQLRVEKILRGEPTCKLIDFTVGDIVKFDPGYHTTKPYYAKVVYTDPLGEIRNIVLVTEIPGYNRCTIYFDNNWYYHSRRMHIIGPSTQENLKLLNDQIFDDEL